MIYPQTSARLAACLLNVSAARNKAVVEGIARAAVKNVNRDSLTVHGNHTRLCIGDKVLKCRSVVLNIFSDFDYNRSVITIVAPLEYLGTSITDACCKAFELIDFSGHHGDHPRLGAVDLVPIHPLTEETSLDECGQVARDVATAVTTLVPGTSVFLFGAADRPECRSLVTRRKQVKWYQGVVKSPDRKEGSGVDYSQVKYDVGSRPDIKYGLTGVGAIPYMTNFNITINTQDLQIGRSIAKQIRAVEPGGLPGIQAMAFPHDGKVEIACNVDMVEVNENSSSSELASGTLKHVMGKYWYTPPWVLEEQVQTLARRRGVDTVGTAIIGFTPPEAAQLATLALQTGQEDFWVTRTERTM